MKSPPGLGLPFQGILIKVGLVGQKHTNLKGSIEMFLRLLHLHILSQQQYVSVSSILFVLGLGTAVVPFKFSHLHYSIWGI